MKIDKKELLVSTVKSVFGEVPLIGTALDEIIFEYSGRLKQKRLNRFIEILAESLTKESEVNLDNIKKENFIDLFESVLRRVVITKSEQKLIRFKDIIVNELTSPSQQIEVIELYLDLVSTLTEEEIAILYNHRYFTEKFEEEIDTLNTIKSQMTKLEQQMKDERLIIDESKFKKPFEKAKKEYEIQKKKIDAFSKYKKAEFYKLPEKSFMFYKQRLFSKGLLIDNRTNRNGNLPFSHMGITEFGEEFINFLMNNESN